VFAEADLSLDDFLGGRLRLLQPINGYRAATDPVLLAAAVDARSGQSVLDMGCGAGTAALCLGRRVQGLSLTGIEIQPDYADLARRNAALNQMEFAVHHADILHIPAELHRGFDHVIANPPYYSPTGSPSPDAGRDQALRLQVPIGDWVTAGARRLTPGGWLTMIFATALLPDALAALTTCGSTAILPLTAREGQPAKRVILQSRKGGRGALRLLAPLVMHDGTAHDADRNSYRPGVAAILRDGAGLKNNFR
jgi:tRNA1Val (adenine37-N6)-methyltransferase